MLRGGGPGGGADRRRQHPGKAVQVGPMKPKLKAPGTKRLKLEYDGPLSNVAFKFNMRRYTLVRQADGSLKVGRCRLTLSNPC